MRYDPDDPKLLVAIDDHVESEDTKITKRMRVAPDPRTASTQRMKTVTVG